MHDIHSSFDKIWNQLTDQKKPEQVRYDTNVTGSIDEYVKNKKIKYIAAAPANFRFSYTGSGLPYANAEQAFEKTPNFGILNLDFNNKFSLDVFNPNSYYIGLGSILVPPCVYLQFVDITGKQKVISIQISNPIPYRALTYTDGQYTTARKNVSFYRTQFDLQPKSQENIFYESVYPKNREYKLNFWGSKPPV